MKKINIILFLVIACIGAYFSLMFSYQDDSLYYGSFTEQFGKNSVIIKIPYKTSVSDKKELIKKLNKYQNEYEFSFFNKLYFDNKNERINDFEAITYYDLYRQSDLNRVFSDEIEKSDKGNIIIEIGQRFNQSKKYKYSNMDYIDFNKLNTEIIVTSERDLTTFSENFKYKDFAIENQTMIGVDEHSSSNRKNFQLQYIFVELLPLILVISIMILVIKILDNIFNQKNIGIYKLHGYKDSFLTICNLKKDSILISIIFIVVGSIYFMLFRYRDNSFIYYRNYYILFFVIQYIIILSINFLMYILTKKTNILTTLKGKLKSKIYIKFCLLVKCIIIFILAISLLESYTNTRTFYYQHSMEVKIHEEIKNMVQIYGFRSDFVNSDPGTVYEDIKEVLNKENLSYINANNYNYILEKRPYNLENSNNSFNAVSHLKKAVSVNENYVRKNKIMDCNNEIIRFDKEDRQRNPVILIPEKLWEDPEVKSLKKNSDFDFFDFIKIKNGQQIYSFSIENAINNYGFIKDAILVIDGNEDIYDYLIPIDSNKNPQEGLNDWLNEYELPMIGIAKTPETYIELAIKHTNNALLSSVFSLVVNFISLLLVIYLTLYIYLKDKEKKIFLLKISGYSFFQRYEDLYIMLVMIYVPIILIMLLLGMHNVLTVLIFIILLDLCISGLFIRNMEKKNMIMILKKEG